ncbi:MAG TPA: mechanosensitive ion channel family protein [Kofleriaceae bacterium]|nr:mechanosensitive ion channel family protein [Kofleriaceae bacterium]
MTEWIPEPLLQPGPWGLAYWQWIGSAVALVIAIILGRLGTRLVLWAAGRLTERTESKWDDEALARLGRPLRLLGCVIAARMLLPLLELPASADASVKQVLLAAFGVALVWCVARLVDLGIARLAAAPWAAARPASRGLLALAGRTMKFVLLLIAAIGFLGALGLPIGTLIAGIGVGSIALAFGAKQTVENLFAAFALGIDQPLREGDFVRTDSGVLGTVESIGLRSTRIRTLDRTVVSMPNGRLADSRIETFGPRDRCRLHAVLALPYATTAAQLREILGGIEQQLRDHPKTFQGEIVVKLMKLGDAGFELEVQTWLESSDYSEFRGWRQEMLLGFVEIVERAGARLAYPARALHVEPPSKPGELSSSRWPPASPQSPQSP